MQRIIPHLWYDKEAKEAADFYVSVFGGDSGVKHVTVLPGTPSGNVDVVTFSIWGYEFMSISAGPYFKFTPATSISVQCHTEAEIDEHYKKLSEGGAVLMELGKYPWSEKYAWINDRYGLSWQLNLPKDQNVKQRICPALMYIGSNAGKAEEAINHYTAIFPDSGIDFIGRYEQGQEPDKEGTIAHADFRLFNEQLMALDSAHEHKFSFTEAVSLMVMCKDQREIDEYWGKLSAVPEAEQCGWLKDRYGVSWQIVPLRMNEMMREGTPEQIERITKVFLPMKKLEILPLEEAYAGA